MGPKCASVPGVAANATRTWFRTGALLRDVDFRVRVAWSRSAFSARSREATASWRSSGLFDLQRKRVAEAPLLARRQDVEAGQIDPGDERRLPFRDLDDDVDLVLLVIQLDVEGADARVGKAAIAVERLDAFEVGFERAAIEIGLVAPGQPEPRLVWSAAASAFLSTCLTPWKSRLWMLMSPCSRHAAAKEGNEEEQKGKPRRAPAMATCAVTHAMPEQRGVAALAHATRGCLLARRDRRSSRGDREHDAEADGDQRADREPDTRNLPEDPDCQSASPAPSSRMK